uniref:Uncharacterized protein n=1 Tax=Leptobrachium leishanense TaxID=445787 RepID=A0A8C5M2F6_9ANUR
GWHAAKLLLCRLLGDAACCLGEPCRMFPPLIIPVHLFICFCRYFLWLTFRLDFTGLSRASLMLLDAVLMKVSKSLVPSLKSALSTTPKNSSPSWYSFSKSTMGNVTKPEERAPAPSQRSIIHGFEVSRSSSLCASFLSLHRS